MDKSFDLASMLKKHQKQHKSRPMQFESVAGGVHRRLESNLKHRKSTRLTSFDHVRNITQTSPEPITEANTKNPERRRQQLEKWKAEKENKKKLLATQKKKKPFIVSAAQHSHPLKYVPPPPIKPVPSTSGRVTRSQSSKCKKDEIQPAPSQSFAPKNAGFHAPQIKTLTKLPKLAPPKSKKNVAAAYTFNPVVPVTKPAPMQTRSRTYQIIVPNKNKAKNTKPTQQVQSSSSSDNEHMQSSSSYVDLTTKMVSSSSEDSDCKYSTGNDTSKSLKSLQSSSGDEPTRQSLSQKTLQFTSSSESEKDSSVNKLRKSFSNASLTSKSKSTPRKSINASKKQLTPKNPVPRSESSSEEKLRSPKSPQDVPMTPEQLPEELRKISPCVTLSRGKDNARKEMKKKMEEGLFEEDESDLDSVVHFQRQLSSEIKRMTEMCDMWDNIYEQIALPDFVQELVLGAVGQARLLMSQKMQQFASLVQRCARPDPSAPLVTPADLHGFWDMLFMQVENVDMRFKKLDELRARNWTEEVPAPPRAACRPPAPAPPRRTRAPPPARSNTLRDAIAAARKAKSQQQEAQPHSEEKTFEAGFFSVRSPARSHTSHSPVPRTPVQRDTSNLLKAVLSSEAEKASASKKSASFAMLRASVLGRNVECDGVEPLPQSPVTHLHTTPARSILKQPQESANKHNKQIRVVLFDDTHNNLDTSADQQNNNHYTPRLVKNKKSVAEENERDARVNMKKKTEEKENATPRLVRQNAVNIPDIATEDSETTHAPRMVTRRMRRSMMSPQMEQNMTNLHTKTPKSERSKRSTKKDVLTEVESNIEEEKTSRRSKTPRSERSKRSSKKDVLTEAESNIEEEKTPRRSQRRRKTDLPSVG